MICRINIEMISYFVNTELDYLFRETNKSM
jgi:hypothetical protein